MHLSAPRPCSIARLTSLGSVGETASRETAKRAESIACDALRAGNARRGACNVELGPAFGAATELGRER